MNLSKLDMPSDLRSRIEAFCADYQTNAVMLGRDGLTLRQYVDVCMTEFGLGPMPAGLEAMLTEAEKQYGTPWNGAGWLGSALGTQA